MLRRLASLLCLALLPNAPLAAQEAMVRLLTGDTLRGRWVDFKEGRLILATATGERALDPATILSVDLAAAADEPPTDLVAVTLADGRTTLTGRIAGGQGERLDLRLGPRAVLPLPYGSFRKLLVPARIGSREVRPPQGNEMDRVYVVVGDSLDVVEGVVAGYGASGLRVEQERGQREVAYEAVAAIFFGLVEEVEPVEGTRVELRFVDGSELEGVLSGMRGGTVVVETVLEADVTVAIAELASLRFAGDRFTLLTEKQPIEVRRVPFFEDGLEPFFTIDRSILGHPLRVGGQPYERGIALRPICDLTYELDGGYETFRARAGIHDEVQPERHMEDPWFATVRFHVDVDGKTVWSSEVVRGGRPAIDVGPIPVRGAQRITLRTDFADRYPAGDHPVWLEPILLR